jgi:hypothetical protein
MITYRSYSFLTQKKSFCPIYKAYVESVTVVLIPTVSSNESSLCNHGWRTYRREQYTHAYITTYLPSGAHVFNDAWTALYTL